MPPAPAAPPRPPLPTTPARLPQPPPRVAQQKPAATPPHRHPTAPPASQPRPAQNTLQTKGAACCQSHADHGHRPAGAPPASPPRPAAKPSPAERPRAVSPGHAPPSALLKTPRPTIQRTTARGLAPRWPGRAGPANTIQLLVGTIFGGKFVVEQPSGEVYFLPDNLKGTFANETPVSFDLADANFVTNVAPIQVQKTEVRNEQDHRVSVQLTSQSCGIEIVRMVYQIVTGDTLSRQDVKDAVGAIDRAGYDPSLGLSINRLPEVLNSVFDYYSREKSWGFKPPKISWDRLELDKLANRLGPHRPAIAVLRNPNHVVVIDSVTGTFPNRQVSYRDPDHASYVVAAEAKFFERAIGSYFTFN